ncbi:hypothetical protein Tco_0635133 [Tanacetum coccineum]
MFSGVTIQTLTKTFSIKPGFIVYGENHFTTVFAVCGCNVVDSNTERLKEPQPTSSDGFDLSLLSASIRKSDTSVLEDLKALSWKTSQDGSLLNLSDHRPAGYGISGLLDTAYRTYWVRRIELLRYGVLGSLGTTY